MTDELKPQSRLSPTSINTYYQCPLKYFYTYIAKMRVYPNIALVKGLVVHKTLEDFFRGYKKDLPKVMIKNMDAAWKKQEKLLATLELTDEQVELAKKDVENMIMIYLDSFIKKVNSLIDIGKAENEQHAYYLIKPKFREKFYHDTDLNLCGYIDRIHEGYDGLITLGDYKTSSKYGLGLPIEYRRQLSLYALLYNNIEKRMPDFVAVDFVRYGETFLLEATPSLLKYARDSHMYVWERTRSVALEDYSRQESNLCRWCDFQNLCSGQDDYEKIKLQQEMKKIMEKEKDVA